MNATEKYLYERDEQVKENRKNKELEVATRNFTEHLVRANYTKNFTWMGIPVLQYPQDLMVLQEIIWEIKPDPIVEIGTAFGGLTTFLASIPGGHHVITVDKEFRFHTVTAIRNGIFSTRIHMIEGNSLSSSTYDKVKFMVDGYKTKLFILDSHHTHDHVLQELRLYSPLVSVGSYIVVFDTAIEYFGHLDKNQNRPWHKGNSPYTAVQEFMKDNEEFIIDKDVEQQALITAAPSGWLRRIKNPH